MNAPEAPPVYLLLLGLLGVWYASLVCHELAHFIAGRLAGLPMMGCGIGFGRPMVQVRAFGATFFISRRQALGGITIPVRSQIRLRRRQLTSFIAGGPVANLLAFVVFSSAWATGSKHWLVLLALAINALLAFTNLLPIKNRVRGGGVFRSDGMQLLQLWKGTYWQSGRPGDQLGSVTAVWTLSRELDAWPGVPTWTVLRSLMQSAVGDAAGAMATLADPCFDGPRRRGEAEPLFALARAQAAYTQDPATAGPAIKAAETACADDAVALAHLAMMRVHEAAALGLPTAELANTAIAAAERTGYADLVTSARIIQLCADPPDNFPEQAEHLLALRGPERGSDLANLGLLGESAKILAERGRENEARRFFVRGHRMLCEMAREIRDADAQAAFVARYARPLQAAARAQEGGVPYFADVVALEAAALPSTRALWAALLGLEMLIFLLIVEIANRRRGVSSEAPDSLVWIGLVACAVGMGLSFLQVRKSGQRRYGCLGLFLNGLILIGVLLGLVLSLSPR